MFSITELEQFYQKDNKEYIILENQEFLKWYNSLIENGYLAFASLYNLQNTIDFIATWYEIKYPEKEFEIDCKNSKMDSKLVMSRYMTFDELLFRLPYNSLKIIENNYRFTCAKVTFTKNHQDAYIRVDSKTGNISSKNLNYIGINTEKELKIEDVVQELKNHSEDSLIDFKELENIIIQHNIDNELRKKILEFISLKLIYSKNVNPTIGYKRAKMFISDFNYNIESLELSEIKIDEIMSNCSEKSKRYIKN